MNLRNFLAHFSANGCEHRNVFYLPQLRRLFPTVLDVGTTEQTVLHGTYSFVTTPDMTCRLVEAKIIQSSTERGSTVSLRVHLSGTKLYEVGEPDSGTVPRLLNAIEEGSSQETTDPSALIPSLPYLDVDTLRKMCVPIDPIHLEADGVFLFKLDTTHAIKTFEFHWCDIHVSQPKGVVLPRPPLAAPIVSPSPLPVAATVVLPFPSELSDGVEVSDWTDCS